jgi:spermidine/putrescine-binding protein
LSKRLLLPCLIIVSTLALAACGSSGDETSKVEEAVEIAATTTDPADCTKLQTQNFMEQTSQETGNAAVKSCEEEAEEEENASAATVANAEVNGSDATAEVTLSGGKSLSGQTLEVALVKDDDQWKMNEVIKFTKFDHDKLIETFEREINGSDEGSSKFATCFLKAFEEANQAEVEKLLFHSNGKGFEEIARDCS